MFRTCDLVFGRVLHDQSTVKHSLLILDLPKNQRPSLTAPSYAPSVQEYNQLLQSIVFVFQHWERKGTSQVREMQVSDHCNTI